MNSNTPKVQLSPLTKSIRYMNWIWREGFLTATAPVASGQDWGCVRVGESLCIRSRSFWDRKWNRSPRTTPTARKEKSCNIRPLPTFIRIWDIPLRLSRDRLHLILIRFRTNEENKQSSWVVCVTARRAPHSLSHCSTTECCVSWCLPW